MSGTVQEHGELLAQQLAAARATQVEATREAEAARVEPAGLREAFVEAQARAAVVAEVVVVEVEAAAEAAAEAAGTREDEAEVQAEVAAGAAAKHQAVNVARCAAAERARLEAMAWAGAEERAWGLEAMLVAVQAGARASEAEVETAIATGGTVGEVAVAALRGELAEAEAAAEGRLTSQS